MPCFTLFLFSCDSSARFLFFALALHTHMFSLCSLLRVPKLLSCSVSEEAVSAAATASGKLTPNITTIRLRLRRNGPAVSYDLRLNRDASSGKLFLNQIPTFMANHSFALASFYPAEGFRAPRNAVAVTMVNGEALQALSPKQLQNVFRKGSDLTMQLTVDTKAYTGLRSRASLDVDDDEEIAPKRVSRKKKPASEKNKKKKASRRPVENYDDEEADYDEENGEEADEQEHAFDEDEDDEPVTTKNKKKKSKKSPAKAKKKVKASVKSHKRRASHGKRSDTYGDADEDDYAYDDDIDQDAAPRRAKTKKTKVGKKTKNAKAKHATKPTNSGSWADEDTEAADEDALIENAMLAVHRSMGTAGVSRVSAAADEEKEEAWFRPSAPKSKSTAERATIQF